MDLHIPKLREGSYFPSLLEPRRRNERALLAVIQHREGVSVLINTSRGQVIDEVDLIDALQHNRLFGAGLDVLEKQPPDPDNPLLRMDNVILTPHNASVTVEKWSRIAEFAWRNVGAVWEGKPANALVIV